MIRKFFQLFGWLTDCFDARYQTKESRPHLMICGEPESIYEILRYLKKHPDARDTVEGIGWWLLEQRMNDCLTDVQSALTKLLAQGLLLELKGVDERRHYQLNKSRMDEISLILRGHDSEDL